MNLVKGYEDRRRPFRKWKKKNKEKRVQGAPSQSQTKKVKVDQTDMSSSTVGSRDIGRGTVLSTRRP